jgi:hypothetical protein
MYPDDRNRIAQLNPTLRGILEAELAAGNTVVETWGGWPANGSIGVQLEKQFRSKTNDLPPNVRYREVNDPHYWKAEIESIEQPHVLTCGFAIK